MYFQPQLPLILYRGGKESFHHHLTINFAFLFWVQVSIPYVENLGEVMREKEDVFVRRILLGSTQVYSCQKDIGDVGISIIFVHSCFFCYKCG